MTRDGVVPVIDLSPVHSGNATALQALARSVDRANREIGFLVVVGHGVDPQLIAEMDAVTRAFFELPMEQKLALRSEDPGTSRGYMPPRSRALARSIGQSTPPDLVEFLAMGQPDVPDDRYHSPERAGINFRPNRWPAEPAQLQAVWTAYYRRMEQLADDLIGVFALALGLPRDWFGPSVDRHCSNLFANHYPPVEVAPEPGQLRLGPHTDYGSLTLLYQDASPGGLQVHSGGHWVDAPHLPGSYIVNIGDLMARWTNDRWVSTLHRVSVPAGGHPSGSRLSIPFFHQPNYDAVIEAIPTCLVPGRAPKYPAITSGRNMEDKTRSSFDC